MTKIQFKRLCEALSSDILEKVPQASVSRALKRSYWCYSWRIGNRATRELFVEHPGDDEPGVLRLGLYFQDSPRLTQSTRARAQALVPVLAQMRHLRRLDITPTYTDSRHGSDHREYPLTRQHISKWLTGKSHHRDLLWKRWLKDGAPTRALARDVLFALIPIWLEWNALDVRVRTNKAEEGRSREIIRELKLRNQGLVRMTRVNHPDCAVCEFNFEKTYGPLGKGFIEVHHLRPISSGRRVTHLRDLVSVCANCHRMLHRPKRTLTVTELRRRLVAAAQR